MLTLGVDSFLERQERGDPTTVGLVTNPSGVTGDLDSTIDLLMNSDSMEVEALFGPTHGIRGNEHSTQSIGDHADEKTGLPVYGVSTHNGNGSVSQIEPLELLIYDIQEIGTRFYTFVQTLERVLEAAAQADTPIVVLDRPNPIAPFGSAGAVDDTSGGTGLPIIHGKTIGELARFFNEEFGIGADLEVYKMEGWSREYWFDSYDIPWVPPSPNMPALRTATVYPGTCMFEGTNLSEGRGTTLPFELVGAPWIHAQDWAIQLNNLDLTGVKFRPAYFTPMFSKHERQDVEGVQVHILDREVFDPMETSLAMLATVFFEYPECEWLSSSSGYVIDDLLGDSFLRDQIEQVRRGVRPEIVVDQVLSKWRDDASEFHRRASEYDLYPRPDNSSKK